MTDAVVFDLTKPPTELIDAREKVEALVNAYGQMKSTTDKAELVLVHAGWQAVRDARLSIERTRESLKAPALQYGREVDAFAKKLTDRLAPVETHLKGIEKAAEIEKARVKVEAEETLYQIRLRQWIDAGGVSVNRDYLIGFREDVFQGILTNWRIAAEKRRQDEIERKEAEENARQVAAANFKESQRLMAERAELDAARRRQDEDRQRAEQAARDRDALAKAELDRQRAELARQQKAIDDAENAKRQAEELERAKAQAAEHALKAKAEEDARKQAELDRLQAEADAEAVRQESLKPIRQKLNEFAEWMMTHQLLPDGLPVDVLERCHKALAYCSESIRKIGEEL